MRRIRLFIKSRLDGRLIGERFVAVPPQWETMSPANQEAYQSDLLEAFHRKHSFCGVYVVAIRGAKPKEVGMDSEASLRISAELLAAARGLITKAMGSIDWKLEHRAHRDRIVSLEEQVGVVLDHIKHGN